MNIVVPMAGAGSRFARAGYALQKPLIEVEGRPMYRWAVDSLPLEAATRLVFVLRVGPDCAALRRDIDTAYAAWQPAVVELPELTRGQAESVWLARQACDPAQPILVHNADTAFTLPAPWSAGGAFGVLVTFEDSADRWSYARLDATGAVCEVREKHVISTHASTGTYYFADTAWLLDAIAAQIEGDQREGGEFYIGPLYNLAIAEGRSVRIAPCSHFTCLGTPEDLAASLPQVPALAQAQAARRERVAAVGAPA